MTAAVIPFNRKALERDRILGDLADALEARDHNGVIACCNELVENHSRDPHIHGPLRGTIETMSVWEHPGDTAFLALNIARHYKEKTQQGLWQGFPRELVEYAVREADGYASANPCLSLEIVDEAFEILPELNMQLVNRALEYSHGLRGRGYETAFTTLDKMARVLGPFHEGVSSITYHIMSMAKVRAAIDPDLSAQMARAVHEIHEPDPTSPLHREAAQLLANLSYTAMIDLDYALAEDCALSAINIFSEDDEVRETVSRVVTAVNPAAFQTTNPPRGKPLTPENFLQKLDMF